MKNGVIVIIIMGQAVLKPGIRFPRGTIDWDAGTYTEWGGKVVRSVDSKTADLLREKKIQHIYAEPKQQDQ